MGNLQTASNEKIEEVVGVEDGAGMKGEDEVSEVVAECSEPVVTTWNGALSYATVSSALVELYFKSVRDIPHTDHRSITVKTSKKASKRGGSYGGGGKTLEMYFDAAWIEDPLRTLKFLFHLRDCRGGKGERELFRALIRHMRQRGLDQHVRANMEHIPTFGYWKDLLMCFLGTEMEDQALDIMATQLRQDMANHQDEASAIRPSLCARHAPSEGGAFDRTHHVVGKLSRKLEITPRNYRKTCLVPLRQKLKVVETVMCAQQWAEIPYEGVPSLAGSRYKKAFNRHH